MIGCDAPESPPSENSMITKRAARPVVVLLLAGLLLAAGSLVGSGYVRNERQFARNAQCRGRLGQIALALQNYHNSFGRLPFQVSDAERKHIQLSWRASLLAFMDASDVYRNLDFSEPWDSPKNKLVSDRAPPYVVNEFRSPNDLNGNLNCTSFVAIDSASFSPHMMQSNPSRIVIVEVHNSGIHWMEPRDLSFAEIQARLIEMTDRGEAVHVLTADGQVGAIRESSLTFRGSADELFKRWTIEE